MRISDCLDKEFYIEEEEDNVHDMTTDIYIYIVIDMMDVNCTTFVTVSQCQDKRWKSQEIIKIPVPYKEKTLL